VSPRCTTYSPEGGIGRVWAWSGEPLRRPRPTKATATEFLRDLFKVRFRKIVEGIKRRRDVIPGYVE
jgi:L-2-hydroxyglutarate oxidase LhgO